MWYEILPSWAIVCIGVAFPSYFAYGLGWLFLKGHPYRRDLYTPLQRRLYLRDVDRFGSPYNFVGLDEFFEQASAAGANKECVCDDDSGKGTWK